MPLKARLARRWEGSHGPILVGLLLLFAGGAQSSMPLQAAQVERGVQSITPREAYGQRIALVVGIDNYDPRVGELRYAVKDALDVSRLLETEFGFKVQLLTNEQATREAIKSAIYDLDGQTSREDQLLFFFAGHGEVFGEGDQERGYILSQNVSDYKSEKIVGIEGISMKEIVDLFLTLKPKHILIILDTCYSGLAAARSRGNPGDNSVNPGQLLKQLTQRNARQVLTAGKSDEEVHEDPQWGNSAFTADLLVGLGERKADSGKLDGLITASELFVYLQKAVSDRTGGRQNPHFSEFGPGQGDFIFIERPGWQPALTKESIRRKIILKHPEIFVFKSANSQERHIVEAWKPYYLFEGEENHRVPIGFKENSQNPDGWLEKENFIEWNSLEVALPQEVLGTPIRLFSDRECAIRFTEGTDKDKCHSSSSSASFHQLQILALLERWGDVYRVFPIFLPNSQQGKKGLEPLPGWLSRSRNGKPLIREAVFMRHNQARIMTNIFDSLLIAAIDGDSDDRADVFRRQVITSLSPITDQQISIDEQLDSLLAKISILPFRTTTLAFTFADTQHWKPKDYDDLYKKLAKKVPALREFLDNPKNKHIFNATEMVFVPRELFP